MLRDYSLIDASGLRRTSALVLTCPAKDSGPSHTLHRRQQFGDHLTRAFC